MPVIPDTTVTTSQSQNPNVFSPFAKISTRFRKRGNDISDLENLSEKSCCSEYHPFAYCQVYRIVNFRSCTRVIDQFRKNEYISCIRGKCREILVLTVFNNSHPRPNFIVSTISGKNYILKT